MALVVGNEGLGETWSTLWATRHLPCHIVLANAWERCGQPRAGRTSAHMASVIRVATRPWKYGSGG